MKQFVKTPVVEYTDEEITLAAKCGHSVMQCIADSFGHKVLPQWDLCPHEYKEAIKAKARTILYHAKACRNLHNSWVKHKLNSGYSLGERNEELKQHPHLVDFNDLPIDVKVKLKAFRAAVMPFRKNLGPGYHLDKD